MGNLTDALGGQNLWTTAEIIERLKNEHAPHSYYNVAKLLKVSQQTVTRYRKNQAHPSDEVCERVAALLPDINGSYLKACIEMERSRTESGKKFWKNVAAKLAGAVAVAIAAVLITSHWFDVSPISPAAASSAMSGYYVKWLLVALAAAAAIAWAILPRANNNNAGGKDGSSS